MEFHIAISEASPSPEVVERALSDIDRHTVVDLDMSGLVMRISSVVTMPDLIQVLRQTGWAIDPQQVATMPSICCGGCVG